MKNAWLMFSTDELTELIYAVVERMPAKVGKYDERGAARALELCLKLHQARLKAGASTWGFLEELPEWAQQKIVLASLPKPPAPKPATKPAKKAAARKGKAPASQRSSAASPSPRGTPEPIPATSSVATPSSPPSRRLRRGIHSHAPLPKVHGRGPHEDSIEQAARDYDREQLG